MVILPLNNGKGSRYECVNYGGITLLCSRQKVYSDVLLARIKSHLQQLHRKEQSGFTSHRSTTDRIATLKMILQTRQEFKQPSWIVYADFFAILDFDAVNRLSLWLLLWKKGVPSKIIELQRLQ